MKRLIPLLFLMLQAGGPTSIPVSGNWNLGAGSAFTQLPDGTEVVYSGYGGTFSQDLGIAPRTIQAWPVDLGYYKAVEGIYTLSFSVLNYFPEYPGYYSGEIDFGTQELCPFEGWGLMGLTRVTVICPSPEYIIDAKSLPIGGPVQSHSNLVLKFTSAGWGLYFGRNNVSLTFTPEN